MGRPPLPKCEYCGSDNVDEFGKCEECGNEKRKPLVVQEVSKEHSGWYELEEKLLAEEAKPHAPPTELPENMKVPQHPDWYDLAGTAGKLPAVRARRRRESPAAKNAVLTFLILAVVGMMSAAGYLLFQIHQRVPTGFGKR